MATVAACLTSVTRPVGLAALGVAGAVAAWSCRVRLRTILLAALPLISFGLFTFLVALLAPPEDGARLLHIPFLERDASARGVLFAADLTARAFLAALLMICLATRMTHRELLQGLDGLGLPPRLSALIYLIVRQIETVTGEVRRLKRGRDARGAPHGFRRTIHVSGAMTQVLMIRLARRAEVQALSLAARGFSGGLPILHRRPVTVSEALLIVALGVIAIWIAVA